PAALHGITSCLKCPAQGENFASAQRREESRAVVQERGEIAGKVMTYTIRPGRRYPFGVTVDAAGVNFSLWGYGATSAELLLYKHARSTTPFQVIRLDLTF